MARPRSLFTPVIQICKTTGKIKKYENSYIAMLEGFKANKINESCKYLQITHKGYFWCYEHDYNEELYKIRLKLNTKPRRIRKFLEYKKCSKCKIEKHYLEFHKYERGYSGTRSDCKKCNTKRSIIYRKNCEKTPQFRLSMNLRTRVIKAMKNNSKVGSAVRDLGCSIEYFKSYLESKFEPGMTWENYGRKGWHLDHVIPLCNFNLVNRDEFLKAIHYTNIQPLWADDNHRKPKKVKYL